MKSLGTSFPKYSLRACYSDPLILSPMMNNFVFVVSFCTFSTRPGRLFDHLRIYRKLTRKRAQVRLTAQNWLPFPVSDEMLLFVFNTSHIYFKYIKKCFLKLGMLMKFRLRILCPLSLDSYKQKRFLETAKRSICFDFWQTQVQ